MKKYCFSLLSIVFCSTLLNAQSAGSNHIIQFVFTSDAHYGIKRTNFRGDTDVDANIVNEAMIKAINSISALTLPKDQGVDAESSVGPVDYVIEGGDIANRMEIPIQSAADSWKQFDADYIHGLTLKNHEGKPAHLFIIPGNHDITDAIGFYKPMNPLTDPTSMVQIYNLMLHPAVPLTNTDYDYKKDRINYSRNINGIHFMFITLWPDSLERIWMEKDLKTVSKNTPVILFTHDEPVCEVKQFTNPNPGHTINPVDKFQNLLAEQYKDGLKPPKDGGNTTLEQLGWVKFIKLHPNLKAYFHGNTNFNQFYIYGGPNNDVALNTFRVDSPMKGEISRKDETKLSFLLVTIDTRTMQMTVRQCLWNTDPKNPDKPVQWGESKTIIL